MLERFTNGDDQSSRDAREAAPLGNRDELIRERMRSHGVSEEEATRLVLSEEELRVGTREVKAGEVDVSKRVETEHVREDVTLRHDEVDIERRPITDAGYRATGATIGEDRDIRIPLHAEEAVVEKRVVPKEELVVRKREVTDTEVVEADLKRERAEIHQDGELRTEGDLRTDRDGRI